MRSTEASDVVGASGVHRMRAPAAVDMVVVMYRMRAARRRPSPARHTVVDSSCLRWVNVYNPSDRYIWW